MNKRNINKQISLNIELETIILGILITCAVVLLIFVIMKFNSDNKSTNKLIIVDNTNNINTKQHIDYNNPALYHSTKSVDGEHQFNADTQWKSQPSKCFDCEAQLESTCGDACVYNATKQKVF